MSDDRSTSEEFAPETVSTETVFPFPVYEFPVVSDASPVPDVAVVTSSEGDPTIDYVMTTKAELASLIVNIPEHELGEYVWKVLEETHPSVRDMLEIYMVIDDDDSVGRLAALVLERILGESPAVVTYFRDSTHAVRFFQRNTHGRIKGVVSDYHMPKLTGIDVLQAVREVDHGKDIPFLLMSGGLHLEDADKVIRVLQEHGGKYERKPWGLSELTEAIQRSLFEGNPLN